MHHVRVALDDHPVGHGDGARRGDAADVVASEIDEHHVLGDLLRIGEQLRRELLVGFARRAARARAGDRPQRDCRAFLPHEDLGRRADHVEVAEIVVEHVRRRVERAQRAVERQRRRREGPRKALREHDLHHVAGGDVVLRLAHGPHERLGAETALRLGHRRGRLERDRHRLAQLAPQRRKPRRRCRERFVLRGIGVDDQRDLAREVVDDDELLGQEQAGCRESARDRLRQAVRCQRAGARYGGRCRSRTCRRGRRRSAAARDRRGAIAAQERLDERERVAFVPLDDDARVLHLDRRCRARGSAGPRRQPDERVAAEALAADDRLEQERERRVRELHVERQRRVEIRERLEDERNAVVALRGEGAEFGFGHGASATDSTGPAEQRHAAGGIACDGARCGRAGGSAAPAPRVAACATRAFCRGAVAVGSVEAQGEHGAR